MKNIFFTLMAMLSLSAFAMDINATAYTWSGGNGNWTNPAMWSPNGVPGAGDGVTINAGICYLPDTMTVTTLTISGGELNTDSTLTVSGNFN